MVQLAVEEIDETRKKLIVTLSADEIAREDRELVSEFSRHVQVPGFRPGKAPEQLVRRRYGKEMAEELKRKVRSMAYEEAMNGSELDIYSIISLDADEVKEGEDCDFTLTVDVNPSFNLPEYEGIPTRIPSSEVTEEEIEEAITAMRVQRADYKTVQRPAVAGDFVQISYEGRVEGRAIAELVPDSPRWSGRKLTWESIGETDSMGVAAVVQGAVGMEAGEEKEVSMDFPGDFEIEALAGSKAAYTMEVHEVREQILPELDEAFLKNFQADNVDQFREGIRDDLRLRKEQRLRNLQRSQIVDALAEQIEFALPASALESETSVVMQDIIDNNLRRGVPQEELEGRRQEIYDSGRRVAAERVKRNILLIRIGEKENIEVTESDINRFLVTEALATGAKVPELVKEIKNNPSRLMSIRRSILADKTLDHVVEKSTVTITSEE